MMMYWSGVKKHTKLFSETFLKLRSLFTNEFQNCSIRYDARIWNFFESEVEHVGRVLRYVNEKLI
jgi:hypothetical protein